MTETRKIDDLKLMKEFDFKKPFTVEIFYESDDAKSPSSEIENNENNQAKELDDVISGIFRDIRKASESNQIDHASSKTRRQSDEPSPVKKAKANKKVDGYELQVVEQLTLECRTENIQNDVSREEAQQRSINLQTLNATQSSNVIRSQANDQCPTYNQNTIQSQQIVRNTNWQDTINNTRPVNNNYVANTRQTSESNNNEQTFISSLNSQNSTNNSIYQNQVDLHTKASECVGTLLTSVSNHLVFIVKAWIEYTEIKSANRSSYEVEMAYNRFLKTKNHFFHQSFASVNNILLPNENDHVFVKKFIEYTLEVARTKNINVTYQKMMSLLNNLFDWVKSRGYPLLNDLLRTPAQPHAQCHTNNRSKEQQGWQCNSTNNAGNVRFRNELPGRDLAINVTSSAIGTTHPVQNVNTPVQSLTYNETVIQQRRPEPQSIANSSSYVEEFQAFARQDSQSLFTGTNEDPKNKWKKKRGPRQKKNQPVASVQEVQVPPPPPYGDRTSAQRNYSNNHLMARSLPLAPPYGESTSTQPNYSENHLISSANYYLLQQQNQECEVNRSLSRDSGIVSPRSPANDFNYSSVVLTPLITHVTSLNPSATQIKVGVCLVCGTSTKQMCRGCYKVYYCTNQCQVSDWTKHLGFCKI